MVSNWTPARSAGTGTEAEVELRRMIRRRVTEDVTSSDDSPTFSEEDIGKLTYETKLARNQGKSWVSIKYGLTSTSSEATVEWLSVFSELTSETPSGTTSRFGEASDFIQEGRTFSFTNPTICEIRTQKRIH
jgi:hypothetical protein